MLIYNLVKDDLRFWSDGAGPTPQSIGPWLGGYQIPGSGEPIGEWAWVTGEAFTYNKWSLGEPNNWRSMEHYLSFYGRLTQAPEFLWNDVALYDYPYAPSGYIVEYDVNPVPILSAVLLGAIGLSVSGWWLHRRLNP
jgi:hypothetical protein